jgi:hypothetical protein
MYTVYAIMPLDHRGTLLGPGVCLLSGAPRKLLLTRGSEPAGEGPS